MPKVCTQPDDFVNDLRWVAVLSNGEVIFQDDDRPENEPASAWLRLRDYVYENSLRIKEFKLEFRSHHEHLPQDADGYFFCKAAVAAMCSQITLGHFVAGTIEKGLGKLKYFKVPELIITSELERSLADCSPECVIMNER